MPSTYAVVQKKVSSAEKDIPVQITNKNINNLLPTEMLTYIFSFLDIKDLPSIVVTCVLWNQILTQENSIWRHFIIRDYHIDPEATDLREAGREAYLAQKRYNRRQGIKKDLQDEIQKRQSVLDEQNMMIHAAAETGEKYIPMTYSHQCAGIAVTSTGGSIGAGFLLAPYIQLPACAVVTFFGFAGCTGGIIGGSFYEQKRTERIIANNQSQIAQINNETTPLLPPKSMTMQKT